MSWTWDSTQIDFSQTCWSFDGYEGCGSTGGYDEPVLLKQQVILKKKALTAREIETQKTINHLTDEFINAEISDMDVLMVLLMLNS